MTTTPSRPTTSPSEAAAQGHERPPGWLARQELALAGGPAAALYGVLAEARLWAAHAAILTARRAPLAAPPPPAASAAAAPMPVRGWRALGPGGARDLRAWGRAVAGDAALAIACRHLCPWLGPPTDGDAACLAQLGRPRPAYLMVVPGLLLPGRVWLLVADAQAPPPAPAWAALVALVQDTAGRLARGDWQPAPPPGLGDLAAVAEAAAAWATPS